MAKWSISKFFSIVMFLVLMIFFFFWTINQLGDLSLFFGFRTSHTVANDIAALMSSMAGVPGKASATYYIGSPTRETPSPDEKIFSYSVLFSSKFLCVTSILDVVKQTTDCVAHPFDNIVMSNVKNPMTTNEKGQLCIEICKNPYPTVAKQDQTNTDQTGSSTGQKSDDCIYTPEGEVEIKEC